MVCLTCSIVSFNSRGLSGEEKSVMVMHSAGDKVINFVAFVHAAPDMRWIGRFGNPEKTVIIVDTV